MVIFELISHMYIIIHYVYYIIMHVHHTIYMCLLQCIAHAGIERSGHPDREETESSAGCTRLAEKFHLRLLLLHIPGATICLQLMVSFVLLFVKPALEDIYYRYTV